MDQVEILVSQAERIALEQMAQEVNVSVSDIVRDMIRERVMQQQRAGMRSAAGRMSSAYQSDPELTAFIALDSEDVVE